MNPPQSAHCFRVFGWLAAAALAVGSALASPLTETTPVQTSPDASSPVIATLKAGSEPTPATDAAAIAPPGWMAVTVAGPFEGYVLNKDLTKGLDVKAGSSIYLGPSQDAGVLTVAAKGERTEITGLHGKWTQVRLNRGVVGYVDLNPAAAAQQPPLAVTPAPVTDSSPAFPPAASSSAAAGRDVTGAEADDLGALPKTLEGRLVSSRTLLPFHHPFAWQIVDDAGHRVAYLDISRLMLTDQIERYVNHEVQVSGIVRPLPSGADIVIAAESLQLR